MDSSSSSPPITSGSCSALTLVAGDREAAADAVQEAFVKAHLRWRKLSRYDDPIGWVRRVAINKIKDGHRRRARKDRAVLRLASRTELAAPPEEIDEFDRLLDALPKQQRAATALFYVDGLPVAEIADCARHLGGFRQVPSARRPPQAASPARGRSVMSERGEWEPFDDDLAGALRRRAGSAGHDPLAIDAAHRSVLARASAVRRRRSHGRRRGCAGGAAGGWARAVERRRRGRRSGCDRNVSRRALPSPRPLRRHRRRSRRRRSRGRRNGRCPAARSC